MHVLESGGGRLSHAAVRTCGGLQVVGGGTSGGFVTRVGR